MAEALRASSTADSAGLQSIRTSRDSKVVRDLENLNQNLVRNRNQGQLPWVNTSSGNCFFGLAILANGVFIGVDLQWVDGFHYGFWAVESMFLLLFLLEILLRLRAERPNYRKFFDCWGITDVSLTLLGCADTWLVTPILFFGTNADAENVVGNQATIFRMMRLLRLVRLVRVLRKFSDLLVLVITIRNSVKAVGWMSLLLGMLIYTGSIITVLLLGLPYRDTYPDIDLYFGSLGSSLFFHFTVVNLEQWPSVAEAAMDQSRWWSLYFTILISFGNCALVNVMVGTIVEQTLRLSMEQERQKAMWAAAVKQFRYTLQMLFTLADLDSSGDLGKEELRLMLTYPRTREIMLAFGMNLHIPASMLHTIVDLNGDGFISFPEFFDACMRLSGSTENLHGVFVQHDICHCHETLKKSLSSLEADLKAFVSDRRSETASAKPVAEDEGLEAEAEIQALRERLDRFGQKQQLMQAELEALKAEWRSPGEQPDDNLGKVSVSEATTGGEGEDLREIGTLSNYDASSLGGASPRPLPAATPASPLAAAVRAAQTPTLFLQTVGREIGVSVMDSVFGDPPRRPHSTEPWARRRPGGLRAAARKQLEAEFAAKKAQEARSNR